MSLFGHGNDLNRQFIARPDSAKEDILYKWPDMTIRRLTQVTVQPDETAIFFKEGKVAGTLPQGRSTLDGALIPECSAGDRRSLPGADDAEDP